MSIVLTVVLIAFCVQGLVKFAVGFLVPYQTRINRIATYYRRDGRIIRALDSRVQPPLGVLSPGGRAPAATEELEPGDRLLAYSDGITEARDEHGRFFGLEQLIEFTERAEQDQVSAPETLRRLGAAVLAHQHGRLQDDATLVMLDWSTRVQHRLLPSDVDEPGS